MNFITKDELKLFAAVMGWALIWIWIIIPYANNYFISNPDYPILYAWALKEFGMYGSLFLIAVFALNGKHKLNLKIISEFSLGIFLLTNAFLLIEAPLCISPDGNLFVTNTNATCYFGTDAMLITTLAAPLLHLSLGNPQLYSMGYLSIFGILIFISIILLKDASGEFLRVFGR